MYVHTPVAEAYIQGGSDSDSDDSFEASDEEEQNIPQDRVMASVISDPPGGTPTIAITSSTKQPTDQESEPSKKEGAYVLLYVM